MFYNIIKMSSHLISFFWPEMNNIERGWNDACYLDLYASGELKNRFDHVLGGFADRYL